MNTRKLTRTALFAALTAAGAFIRIPLGYSSITLQFLCTAMAGCLLGPAYGAASQAVYVALGLIGLPIFTQGGGLSYLMQPTCGFLIGLIPTAWLIGLLTAKRELRPLSEAVTGDPALSSPVKQAAQRAEFFDAYARQPFQQVRNHYLTAQLLSGSRKQGAKPGKRSEKPSLFTVIKERLWKKH